MRALSFGLLVTVCGASALATVGCGGGTSSESGKDASAKADVLTTIIILPPPDAGHDAGVDATTGVPDATTTKDAGMVGPPPPTDAELNTYPAFTPNVPQVISGGGPVVPNPIFVPVIFAGDQYAAQIPTYLTAIGQSQYWTAAVAEYGVGAGTMGTPIILNETMPMSIDDSQVQVWLANEMGTDPRFGALEGTTVIDAGPFDGGSLDANAPLNPLLPVTAAQPPNVIYVLFFPDKTSVTLQGAASCSTFGGYHNSFAFNSSNVVYAMIPRCDGGFGPLQGFDAISGTASHELAEASTDPQVGSGIPAYVEVDNDHFIWEQVLGGGEVGDMCAQFPQAFFKPAEASMSSYYVQRIWSNQAAAAGNDPCQPPLSAAAEPFYFNAVPKFGEVQAEFQGGFGFSTIGGSAPVGQSTAIEIDLFSSAKTGQTWEVQAYDANQITTGGGADLVFSPSIINGVNGDKLELNVSNLGNGQTTHPFILISSLGTSGGVSLQNWWIGLVTN